jgi:hypothetical protein
MVAASLATVQDRPMKDVIRPLEKVLAEADAVIRVRLKELGLEVPHLVIAVTPDGEVMLRSNVSPDVLRSFGEDLKNIADELDASPAPDGKSH